MTLGYGGEGEPCGKTREDQLWCRDPGGCRLCKGKIKFKW